MAGVRPIARLGALDSKAVFDSHALNTRKNTRHQSYYPKVSAEGDDCVLEHEILLASTESQLDGDKDLRVFSSLNGLGPKDGITPDMDSATAVMLMKDKLRYAGVSVTDFMTKQGVYAPEEGRHLTISHGGLNTVQAAVEPVRAGDMLKVDFPTKEETHKMRRRRGASYNKVTAIVRRHTPYSTAAKVRESMTAMIDKRNAVRSSSLKTANKWDAMCRDVTDSYIHAAAAAARMSATGSIKTAQDASEAIKNGTVDTGDLHAYRNKFATLALGLGPASNGDKRAHHFATSVERLADAIEDDRRWVIGKCTTGCREGGYATVALGVR